MIVKLVAAGIYRFMKRKAKQSAAARSFRRDFTQFRALTLSCGNRFDLQWDNRQMMLEDKTGAMGFDAHYVYHTAWAARVLAAAKPVLHIDLSSYIYFSTIISAFIPAKFYDYRPAALHLSNLTSEEADLVTLPFADNSITSISCMHVVEHVGLGRYGDALDPDGDLKAIRELRRVLAPDGSLLFVVPVGRPRVVFNAHRVYSYDQVVSYFPDLHLKEFRLLPDNSEEGLVSGTRELSNQQYYGCGCFWFTKTG